MGLQSPSETDCSSSGGPPWGHKSCQKTCSSLGSSLHAFTGPASSLLWHRFPTGSRLPLGSHLPRLQGNLCSTACSTSSPPSSASWVSAGLFLSNIPTPLFSSCNLPLCSNFYPSFTMLPQRPYLCHWRAQSWPAVGESWSHLAPLDTGEVPAASHKSHPSSNPQNQNLAMQTQCNNPWDRLGSTDRQLVAWFLLHFQPFSSIVNTWLAHTMIVITKIMPSCSSYQISWELYDSRVVQSRSRPAHLRKPFSKSCWSGVIPESISQTSSKDTWPILQSLSIWWWTSTPEWDTTISITDF